MKEIIKLNQLERGLNPENVRADIKAVSSYSKPIFRIRRQMSKLDSDRTFRLNNKYAIALHISTPQLGIAINNYA